MSGVLRSRVLRMLGAPRHHDELEAQIAETLGLVQSSGARGWLPMVLAERAGLARLRGETDAMARDLAEARRLWEQMGAQRDRLVIKLIWMLNMNLARRIVPSGNGESKGLVAFTMI